MKKSNNIFAILLILIFIFVLTRLAWFSFDAGLDMSKNQIQGQVLTEAKAIDDFSLVDNKQRPFTLQNLKDRWSLLFFGYTSCSDDCSTTLKKLKQVHALLSSHLEESAQVVFVSIDVERDSPETLDKYLSNFSHRFVGVSGSAEGMEKFTENLGVHYKKDHDTSIILVNPDARVKAILTAPHRVADMHNDIMTIIENKKVR